MSATVLSDLPQTVCDAVLAALPELKACEPMAGRFSLEELKRKGLRSPSVLVSTLGAKQDDTYSGAAHSFGLQMAAYVVTKDGLGAPRDIRAANICQVLLSTIPDEYWGVSACGEARNVRMHTLVSSKSQDHAVSLWAVTWDQPISFYQPQELPLGVDLYVANGEGEYQRIGEAPDV